MIDEKKLIEDILQHENVLASANHVYKSGYRDRQYEIIDTIKRQPKVGEWIPVSDRLPEEYESVLLSTNFGDVLIGFLTSSKRWAVESVGCCGV